MAFKLYLGFTLFLIFGHCFAADDNYEEAKEIAEQKTAEYEQLYEKYNIPQEDYQWTFAVEIFSPSQQNMQANVLVDYQRLLKNDSSQCNARTFHDCLQENTDEIPKEERCQVAPNSCDSNEKYSQISGLCNNLDLPTKGKSNTVYSRWLKPFYADGINEIRKAKSNKELPNPRVMGNRLENAKTFTYDPATDDERVNNFAGIMFSQAIAHDISSRRTYAVKGNTSNPIRCCNSENTEPLPSDQINPNCIPMQLPANDTFYEPKGVFCQNYIRMQSTTQNDGKIDYAPENIMTHFLDVSTIYPTSEEQLKQLRANDSGLFQMDSNNLFPVDDTGASTAADFRFSQTTVLSVMYSLLMQFHNVIATNLQEANPDYTNDQTFFESRRLVIAIYQHIVLCEWLPLVMDEDVLKSRNLSCKESSFFSSKYNGSVDPSTMNDFANNAFKYFHVNVPSTIELADESYNVTEVLRFSDAYFVLDTLPDKYDSYLRGLLGQPQRTDLASYSGEIRNLFMKAKYRGKEVGVDGFIVDTMRSRDGGTAPFVDYFVPCFSTQIDSFDDLEPFFELEHLELLKSFYEDVNDIDLMTAILLEKRSNKNVIGKIGGCIMAEQFHRYKSGDRFFYTHSNSPNPFSSEQLDEIRKMTFSKIICMTRSIKQVPRQGFVTISEENPIVTCDNLNTLDINIELLLK